MPSLLIKECLLSFSAESFVLKFVIHKWKIKILRTIILLFVLYGCETCLFAVREECKLKVFENKVLRRLFGPKRDEVTREWRKLHNDELNDLYSPNIFWVIKSVSMRRTSSDSILTNLFTCLLTYLLTYLLTRSLTHSLTHLLIYLLHRAESFLKS